MKYCQPPEVLKKLSQTSDVSLDSFRLFPHAVYFAMASIPMPWQQEKCVDVVYHISGNISFVRDRYKIGMREFHRRWRRALDARASSIHSRRTVTGRSSRGGGSYMYSEDTNEVPVRPISGMCPALNEYLYGRRKPCHPVHIAMPKNRHIVSKGCPAKSTPGTMKLISELLKLPDFQKTRLDWIDAASVLVKQGRHFLEKILYVRKISYFKLDDRFGLVRQRPITTKERKKSRLGISFHIVREMLRIFNEVIKAFKANDGARASNKLMAALWYVFSNVGTISGIYRYKYKISNQIKKAKAHGGPENGWVHQWRLYCSMLRGYIPFLERCIGNMLDRLENGRERHETKTTKQRIQSTLDVGIKSAIKKEFGRNPRLLQHFNEKWRCWKADTPYKIEADGDEMERCNALLDKYCEHRAQKYIKSVVDGRARQKDEIKKQNGRVLRLYIKNERARQKDCMANPPLKLDDATTAYRKVREFFRARAHERAFFIEFPHGAGEEMLGCAVARLRRQCGKKDQEFLETVELQKWMHRVKADILAKRVFKEVGLGIKRATKYVCYYRVDISERITDAFVDEYLWHEAGKMRLFPRHLALDGQNDIDIAQALSAELAGQEGVLYVFEHRDLLKHADFTLVCAMLRLVMDQRIVDYIVSRLSTRVVYKGMEYTNHIGIAKGFQFSSFLYALWALIIDITFFKPGEILIRMHSQIYLLGSPTQDPSAFSESIRARIPPSFGHLILTSTSAFPYEFVLGHYQISLTDRPAANTIPLEVSDTRRPFRYMSYRSADVCIDEFKAIIKDTISRNARSSFIKLANEWNARLIDFASYFRSREDLERISECEKWIKMAIKEGINSKMPVRFPPTIFYAPITVGGLGMISISGYNYKKQLPDVLGLFEPWGAVLGSTSDSRGSRSCRVLSEFSRFRFTFTNYSSSKRMKLAAPDSLKGIDRSKIDCLQCLGGLEKILELTLFKSLKTPSFADVQAIWDVPKYNEGTKAQKSGCQVLPNRRFVLWWSPVLNRSRVFMGYETRVDQTGVGMHGKLNNLKTFYVQIFRGRLWRHIHEELLACLSGSFNDHRVAHIRTAFDDTFGLKNRSMLCLKGEIHKSTVDASADGQRPAIMSLEIDAVLVWGDYDTRNIDARAQKVYRAMKYPRPTILVVLDLCYLSFAILGYPSEPIKCILKRAVELFVENARTLSILRSRLKIALSVATPNSALKGFELFDVGAVAEFANGCIFLLSTQNGNLYFRNAKCLPREAGCDSDKGLKNAAAVEILRLAKDLLHTSLAVDREMIMYISKYIPEYNQITVYIAADGLRLSGILKCMPKNGGPALRGVQNVYFDSTSPRASFYRLYLIFKSLELDEGRMQELGIAYKRGWCLRDKEEWGTVEAHLKDICRLVSCLPINYSVPDKPQVGTGNFWMEDYKKRGEAIRTGQLFADKLFQASFFDEEKGDRTVRYTEHLECDMPIFHDEDDAPLCPNFEESLDTLVATPIVQVPKNVVMGFRIISMTDSNVRAYIESISPFRACILPQYINTAVELPRAVGIITNRLVDYKGGLQLVIGDSLAARRWHDGRYIDIPYEVVSGYGEIRVTEWNYNFRIELFNRSYDAEMRTPRRFYDPYFRGSHFSKFIEAIKKYENGPDQKEQ